MSVMVLKPDFAIEYSGMIFIFKYRSIAPTPRGSNLLDLVWGPGVCIF